MAPVTDANRAQHRSAVALAVAGALARHPEDAQLAIQLLRRAVSDWPAEGPPALWACQRTIVDAIARLADEPDVAALLRSLADSGDSRMARRARTLLDARAKSGR